ncbi:MAG TPA: hypothetical protein VN915_06715 [Elusimicrobiota bacterium]|nr:hypothetical protein [Elusimicrobiota bacterium]
MTVNAQPKKTTKRVGRRWKTRTKETASCADGNVSYACRTGKHSMGCSSLSCGCWCH